MLLDDPSISQVRRRTSKLMAYRRHTWRRLGRISAWVAWASMPPTSTLTLARSASGEDSFTAREGRGLTRPARSRTVTLTIGPTRSWAASVRSGPRASNGVFGVVLPGEHD